MSHFVILVQLPKTASKTSNVEKALDKALAPFSEELRVDPYEVTCHCVKHKVSMEVHRHASEKFGDIEELRDMFHKLKTSASARKAQERLTKVAYDEKLPREKRDKAYAASHKIDEKIQAAWAKFIHLAEREAFEKRLQAELEPKMTPEGDCEECKGTGKYDSTYNPNSQWDWYTIGGRWGDYFGEKLGDVIDGKAAKQVLAKDDSKIPFAILSKDGKWHEKGKMGWFGMSFNEKADKDWNKEIKDIIASFDDDDVIVAVDCHI